MRIDFHRNFDKGFAKLAQKQKARFKERLILFAQSQYAPELNNHVLKGKYQGYRSINVTDDVRAIFIMRGKEYAEFVHIGKHSKLYG